MALPNADLEVRISLKKEKLKKANKSLTKFNNQMKRTLSKKTRSKAFKVTKNNSKQASKELNDKLRKIFMGLDEASERALMEQLKSIQSEALRLTPVDTGLLRNTSFVATETLKTRVVGKVGYNIRSGPVPSGVQTGAEYAIFVHEDRNVYHEPPTQAGFLFSAVNNQESFIKERMGALISTYFTGRR